MWKFIRKISLLLFLISFALISISPAEAYVRVKGYYRKDGTYVAPHVRSNPNGLKYDNYGWTPSQGLYNPSYGTKESTWDTPTYITDTDYYEGLNLYNSGSSATTDNSSSNNLIIPKKTNSEYCQDSYGLYSGWNGTLSSDGKIVCGCLNGYEWNRNKTSCVLENAVLKKNLQDQVNALIKQLIQLQKLAGLRP